jgi:hypothetical protein
VPPLSMSAGRSPIAGSSVSVSVSLRARNQSSSWWSFSTA